MPADLPVGTSLPEQQPADSRLEGARAAGQGQAGHALRELVDLAQKGEVEAFGRLYDLLADDVYRYFYYHLGSSQDAEDLVSRTFIRAWRGIHSFRWRGRPFESWLFTLARNMLYDFYRERKAPTTSLDERRIDPNPGPESMALASAEAEETRAALERLTEEQRQVLVLKFYMDRDNREIAEIMGKKEGTVRALQMRALQALRRQLQSG
jgi:RNA polymerase sigma-70 factor, ECF subfamily